MTNKTLLILTPTGLSDTRSINIVLINCIIGACVITF
jgi:hypothetical protein